MKFKKILFTLGAVFAFSLAACNNKNNDSKPTPEPTPTPEPAPATTDSTYLTFIDNNKIRVDIMDTSLASNFTYGNAVVETTKQMAYSSATKLALRGTVSANTVNFVVVIDIEGEDRVVVNPGIQKDSLEEYLSDTMVLSGGKKVYVAISTGTVNWTKGLNADLDAKLNQLNNA